ncbi:MAG: Gfo/Idh/MocA family protein [Promethearchaeota archaeon]
MNSYDKINDKKSGLDVTIIGAGMIVKDQILPSIYHLQRLNMVRDIRIVATSTKRLRKLAEDKILKKGFPGQSFIPYPPLDTPPDRRFPELYKKVLEEMEPYNAVIIALPDQIHYRVLKDVIAHNQHILCVKPLVLKYKQAEEIADLAYNKGLFVGIEYHKRFDRRNLLAKRYYQEGKFGEFIIGEAKLIEPYYYRHSNFQNWFLPENTDPFVYVGCHYWDLVYFITGLKPVEVSVKGIKRKFPNGNQAFMWAHGRIVYENGAILSIINGLGYPNEAAGSNQQGIEMFFETNGDQTAYLKHNDQFRGVEYSFYAPKIANKNNNKDHEDNKDKKTKNNDKNESIESTFQYINPDYFKLVPFEENIKELKPVGYGYDSIEANMKVILKLHNVDYNNDNHSPNLNNPDTLLIRKRIIDEINQNGIIATPQNSKLNEIISEAARLSILNDGKNVAIKYTPNGPQLEIL